MAAPLPRRQKPQGTQTPPTTASPSQLRVCPALSKTGDACHRKLSSPDHRLCWSHHAEYKSLNQHYKQAEIRYGQFPSKNGFHGNTIRAKLECGKMVLKLREEVNRRFFSLHSDNRGHIQRILRLNTEIEALEAILRLQAEPDTGARNSVETAGSPPDADSSKDPDSNGESDFTVYGSLLALHVPIFDLDHLPGDHSPMDFQSIKHESANEMISKPFHIASALDGGQNRDKAPALQASAASQACKDITRFASRGDIRWEADTAYLHVASKIDSMYSFITQTVAGIRDYIQSFDSFGRADTLQSLRDAVCDYFMPLDPPSYGTVRTSDR